MEKDLDKDIEIVKEDLNNWKKEFGTEGSVAINIKSLENVLEEFQGLREFSAETVRRNAELQAELETYKKIAEFLADKGNFHAYIVCRCCVQENTEKTCKDCIIDWAKNEVLKNDK